MEKKSLPDKNEELSQSPQNLHRGLGIVEFSCNPSKEKRQRQADPWGSLASQPSLLVTFRSVKDLDSTKP